MAEGGPGNPRGHLRHLHPLRAAGPETLAKPYLTRIWRIRRYGRRPGVYREGPKAGSSWCRTWFRPVRPAWHPASWWPREAPPGVTTTRDAKLAW